MGEDVLGSLIGAGAGLANYALGQNGTRANMRLQNRLNAQQMIMAHNLNKDYQSFVWDNAIPRSVSSQKNAGLNPATMAGTTVGTTGNPLPSGGSGIAAPSGSIDPLTGASVAADLRIKEAQRKNIDADTEIKLQETAWKEFMNSSAYKDLTLQGMENSAIKDLYEAFESDSSVDKIGQEILNLRTQNDLNLEQINYLAAQVGKMVVEADNLRKQGKLLEKDIQYYDVKVGVDRAMSRFYHSSSNKLDEETRTQVLKTGSQAVQFLSEEYAYEILTYLDPDTRALLELGESAGDIVFKALKAYTKSRGRMPKK